MTPFRIPIALIFLAASGLFLSGCMADDVQKAPGEHLVSVRVSEVTGGEAQEITLRFSGIVRSTQRATLTFQVSGTLRERARPLPLAIYSPGYITRRWSLHGIQPEPGWTN